MTKKKTDSLMLVNKLSVSDAQHLYRMEGGFLSSWEMLFQIAAIALVHAFVVRAIYLAHATVWHLVLPMVAEYLVYLLAIPVFQVFVRHAEMKSVSWQCLRVLGIQAIVLVAVGVVWPLYAGKDIAEQWSIGWEVAWNWIVGTQMHWPIVLAGICSALNVKRSVDKLVEFGPPFAGPGVGCAMRVIVFFFGIVVGTPVVMIFGPLFLHLFPKLEDGLGTGLIVWLVWLIFLAADFGRLGMRWDIQRRLQRAGKLPNVDKLARST